MISLTQFISIAMYNKPREKYRFNEQVSLRQEDPLFPFGYQVS